MSDVPQQIEHARPGAVSLIAMLGIVSIAVVRTLVSFGPSAVFAGDPAMEPAPVLHVGPVGSLWLDICLLLFAGCAMLAEAQRGRRVEILTCVLPFAVLPFVLIHGRHDFNDLVAGVNWFAAGVACVAVMHLSRDRSMRMIMLALLAAVVAPLVVKGLGQVFDEHPRDMAYYRANREAVLADQGIDPNSNSAQIYERRLGQAEASGWFRMANVYGSFMVFGLILWLGAFTAVTRTRRGSAGMMIGAGVMMLAAGVGLYFAGSKGAFAAAAVGSVIALIGAVRPELILNRPPVVRGWIAIALPFLALAAVAVRGVLLPEDFAGDRSVLFRWQYLVGAGRAIADAGVLGVGPTGFQDAYVQHRLPTSPEEVASAHSVMVDWIASLGIGGVALVALLLLTVWSAAARLGTKRTHEPQADSSEAPRGANMQSCAILVALVAFGGSLWVERFILADPISLLLRLAGVGAFVAAALGLFAVRNALHEHRAGFRIAIVAAFLAVVAHTQIELSFTHPGSATWLFVLAGVAAGGGYSTARAPERSRVAVQGWALSALIFAIAIGFAILRAGPAWVHQQALESVADALRIAGETQDERTVLAARRAAVEDLLAHADDVPGWALAREVAFEQAMLAASHPKATEAERIEMLTEAVEITRGLVEVDDSLAAIGLDAVANTARYQARPDADAFRERAIAARRQLADRDPQGVQTHLALADLLWEFGDPTEARELYQRTLELNANWHMDELKQLQQREVERIRSRLQE